MKMNKMNNSITFYTSVFCFFILLPSIIKMTMSIFTFTDCEKFILERGSDLYSLMYKRVVNEKLRNSVFQGYNFTPLKHDLKLVLLALCHKRNTNTIATYYTLE